MNHSNKTNRTEVKDITKLVINLKIYLSLNVKLLTKRQEVDKLFINRRGK